VFRPKPIWRSKIIMKNNFIIIFRAERLEVLLKMNKLNLVGLMGAFKRGLSKNVTFKPAKLGNFDKVRD
jgi:hypothetical protein